MAGNPFEGYTLAKLQTWQTAYEAAFLALASGQSYALNGRQLQRADLESVKMTLGQLQAAIDSANATTTTSSLVSFTGR